MTRTGISAGIAEALPARIGRRLAGRLLQGTLLRGALLSCALLLAGCAMPGATSERDPWETMNRKVFWFNLKLDDYVLQPTARGWNAITSHGVQESVDNFFINLRAPIHLVNNLLQAKFTGAATELGRFVVNTTVGVLGFFDPATGWGMPDQPEDLGQTLAVWGIPSGPYLVLPFFGPSNPRDTVGLAGDIYSYSYVWRVNGVVVWVGYGVDLVNTRALLLDSIQQAQEASLDYYVLVRNAYLQRRRIAIEGEQTEPKPADQDLYNDDLYDEDTTEPAAPEPSNVPQT